MDRGKSEACGPLLAQADAACGDTLSSACLDATSRALACLRRRSTFMGRRARVVLECVAEHRRDPTPCDGLRADFVRDTTHLLDLAKPEEGWQKRVVEQCEAPLAQVQKCHALVVTRGGEERLSEACEAPLGEMGACVQRVACPARFRTLRTCLQSSGGREEACDEEVDRWIACTINTELEALRGLGVRAGRFGTGSQQQQQQPSSP